MSIKPILFNTEMVRAILDGRKTVTRRVVKPANPFRNKEGYCQGNGLWIDGYSKYDEPNGHIKDYSVSSCWLPKSSYIEKYAPCHPKDILYVRETWTTHYVPDEEGKPKLEYCYKADGIDIKGECLPGESNRWYPSIHMPKEAARIFLKVTDVRVEWLQEITDEDCEKEGLENFCKKCSPLFSNCDTCLNDGGLKEDFKELWDSTIKKSDFDRYGWYANPWVWVIEFERCKKPEGWCKNEQSI